MVTKKIYDQWSKWIAALGATNVGLVALLDLDIVQWLAGALGMAGIATALYAVVGASGVYLLWRMIS